MPYAFLGLGSNVGDKTANLQRSVDLLSEQVALVQASSVYDTAPKYFENQERFANAVVKVFTNKSLSELFEVVEAIEKTIGKKVEFKYGPRVIDVDVLFYGDAVFDDGSRKVPHPLLQERRFVSEPLCEIAPNFVHPVLKKTARELLDALPQEDVKKIGTLSLYSGNVASFSSLQEAEQAMAGVGVEDAYSIKTMALKCFTKVVRLKGVRATMANILKQEMLALGGDAAVHKDCVSNQVDRSEVLLIGNIKQLRQLVSKLRVQVAEAQEVAKAVEKALE